MIRFIRNSLVALAAVFCAIPAFAQVQPTYVYQAWVPQGRATLTATTGGANVALPANGNIAAICNNGSVDAFINFGIDNTVTASTTTSYKLAAGKCGVYHLNGTGTPQTWIAGITVSSSAVLYIETGSGDPQPSDSAAASGGGGGTTTANQGTAGSQAWPVATSPTARTFVALDASNVTTGGTAVNALTAGHRTAGGFLQNPPSATINLCINEIGTASGTTSAGNTTCILPGQSYNLVPAAGAVSVISSDSAHPFSGYGLN